MEFEGALSAEKRKSFNYLVKQKGCDYNELERRLLALNRAERNVTRPDFRRPLGISRERLRTLPGRILALADDIERANRSVASPVTRAPNKDGEFSLMLLFVCMPPPRSARGGRFDQLPTGEAQAVNRDLRRAPRVHAAIAEAVLVDFVRRSTGRPHFAAVAGLVGCSEEAINVRTKEFRKRWGNEPLPSIEYVEQLIARGEFRAETAQSSPWRPTVTAPKLGSDVRKPRPSPSTRTPHSAPSRTAHRARPAR
jgi:hypothetical protein